MFFCCIRVKTMLKEYFNKEEWRDVMAGIKSCSFSQSKKGLYSNEIKPELKEFTVEILFLTNGNIKFTRKDKSVLQVEKQGILMISDCSDILKAEVLKPLEGTCLSIDCENAKESLSHLCQIYGDIPISMKWVGEQMALYDGLFLFSPAPWNNSIFTAIKNIDLKKRGQYCTMKCFELVYLVYAQNSQNIKRPKNIKDIENYILEHLYEKLTINELSSRFNLSQTAFKNYFHNVSGQPIHKWILEKRMERACYLLKNTKMSILEIAQSVGYDSVSQFNFIFKRTYGYTPTKYRKMSFSDIFPTNSARNL